jgi:hypothetical protein
MPQCPDFYNVGCATGNDESTKQQENPVVMGSCYLVSVGYEFVLGSKVIE